MRSSTRRLSVIGLIALFLAVVMAIWVVLGAAETKQTSAVAANAAGAAKETAADTKPDKCTAMYVGKDVSAEGTMIIARSEDQGSGAYNKLFYVEKASNKAGRQLVDTGEDMNNFAVDLPKETFKYTTLQDAKDAGDGAYPACCINEYGLTVIGTVSTEVSEEYEKLDPVLEFGSGIREAILPAIPACQAKTAREGVEVLGAYLDKYSTCEWNTILFSDKNEAWIFENYGGTTYCAMKLPSDKVAVFGNQIMIDWVDFNDTENFFFSKNLKKTLDKLENPVKDKKGRYNLVKSITPGGRDEYSNMRTWRGHQVWAPNSTGDYSDNEYYSLLFTPEKKISVTDVMQLYGDRYEGTEFDMNLEGNEGRRPIGVTRQGCTHIVQTFDQLPDRTCQLQWLSMGNAEHAVFVPAFSGITDTYAKYQVDNEESGVINDSYYFTCKKICSLAETDREFLSQGVKDYNLKQEKKMLKEMLAQVPVILKKYDRFNFVGDRYVTSLAEKVAVEQYNNAEALYKRLAYVQMDNLNDRADNERKVVFEMK